MFLTELNGVYGAGIHCGIKHERKDLCYIYVPDAVASAAVFTQNKVTAAPVQVSQKCMDHGVVKAVIINSGNANAVTGKQGMQDAKRMAQLAAQSLGLDPLEVAVASTGIIGVPMPMEKLETGIPKLLSNKFQKDGEGVARGIMTTDTTLKSTFVEAEITGKKIIVSGVAKGSGMIAPNMATMLAFLATNVAIDQAQLKSLFSEICEETFNRISVDTDASTNDMAMIFATGEHEVDLELVKPLLHKACMELALKIVEDGEGMTKLIETQVQGAASVADAKAISKQIIDSPLVKTAIHGCDPNWGRILMAIGKDPSRHVIQEKIDLSILDEVIMKNGEIVDYDEERLTQKMKESHTIVIQVNLNVGSHSAAAWGCDLTKRYIDINTDYN